MARRTTAPNVAPYRWELEENGIPFDITVEPRIMTNDLRLMLRSALSGAGITFAMEETFRPHIEAGELDALFEDHLPTFPGLYFYFPQRRNTAPIMRALIDHLRWSYRLGTASPDLS